MLLLSEKDLFFRVYNIIQNINIKGKKIKVVKNWLKHKLVRNI